MSTFRAGDFTAAMTAVFANSWRYYGEEWSTLSVWQDMDWLSRGVILFLGVMLVNAVVRFGERFVLYALVSRQSVAFVRNAGPGLDAGKSVDVVRMAKRYPHSHVGSVVTAGLIAFSSVPQTFTNREAVEVAQRAVERTRKMVASELKVGLDSLATIASSAPFIGLLGTCFGIMDSFRGVGMQKGALVAMTMALLSEALVTTAMGLVVAVPANWFRAYLLGRMDTFESEMSNAALETLTYIRVHPQMRAGARYARSAGEAPFRYEPVPHDHQRVLLVPMWGCTILFAYVLIVSVYQDYRLEERMRSYKNPVESERVAGQDLLSPDRRFRAVVSDVWWQRLSSAAHDADNKWSCASNLVTVSIVPNDRPLAWRPYFCGKETEYALERGAELEISKCQIPQITWRTDDELLVQCDNCSSNQLRKIRDEAIDRKITVRGVDGKRINAKNVQRQLACP